MNLCDDINGEVQFLALVPFGQVLQALFVEGGLDVFKKVDRLECGCRRVRDIGR